MKTNSQQVGDLCVDLQMQIALCIQRIRPGQKLLVILQAVSIGIERGIAGGVGVEAVGQLPGIGQTVPVGVNQRAADRKERSQVRPSGAMADGR